MAVSALSVFSDPDDFQTALRHNGDIDLVAIEGGNFWARLSRISLDRVHLFACEERLPRIAFMSVPVDMVRITLPPQGDGALTWSGVAARRSEIVTHSGGYRFHERTDGPCRWGTVWISARDLANSSRAIRGATLALQRGEHRWRTPPAALRSLVGLHKDVIHATEVRARLPLESEAARGLEQQLIFALVECLEEDITEQELASSEGHADIMARFEDAISAAPLGTLSVVRIAAAVGVSSALLRRCCHAHLGITPGRYLHLHRMTVVRRALRDADPSTATVEQTIKPHGFRGDGRFAATYRAMFGELPSATLRRTTLR